MSALVGLLLLDGAPCPQPVVQTMLSRLRHRVEARGWAGAQVRCQAAVGLGYAPLLSTPQSLWELERPDAAQTLTHNGQSLWITSDVRLDNRGELAQELGMDGQEAREWNDGRFILEAYARWGQETPAHLRGDFAFAIWDAARHRLFCARDRFGTKPFYYAYKPGQFFAFANEIKALWPVPGLNSDVNETQISNYLLGRFSDKTSTFYREVRRLSPATWMEIALKQSGEVRENTYWELDSQRELNLPRDEDYAEMLRETFTQSVRERMRCNGKFTVFLSGGLDSSSVAAVAEREASAEQKPVPALSRVFDRFPECDERAFIQQNLQQGEFEPIWSASDDLTALTDIRRLLWHLDQPSFGPNTCTAWAQYRVLQDFGASVVLDGHGGDEVVFTGYQRVNELLMQGAFWTGWQEMRSLRRNKIIQAGDASSMIWKSLLWHARGTRGIGRLLSLSSPGNNRRHLGPAKTTSASDNTSNAVAQIDMRAQNLLAPQLAARTANGAAESSGHTVREQHFNTLDSTAQPMALEVLDAMAGAHAIESRCPFWEQNLVEICLAFPSAQKMRHGFNRYVMRQAMEGVLHPQVQWRPDKTDFAPQMIEGLCVVERNKVDELLEQWRLAVGGLQEYVALEEVNLLWVELQQASLESSQTMLNAALLWRVLSLGLWLSQNESA